VISRLDRKITDLLSTDKFTLSAEIIPPRNGSSSAVLEEQITKLTNAGADFMAVTKGAGGSLRGGSLPIALSIKERFHLPCIAHFTCRDLLPEEVENQLIDHHLFGIRNILALRGDPPQGSEAWVSRAGSHAYAYQLVEQIRNLNEGRYLEREGFKSGSQEKTDFCIGVACYPDHAVATERVQFFQHKVRAGAQYGISQMLFDAESYARFQDEIQKNNCSIPVLPGTRLLKSKEQAQRMALRFQIPVPKTYLDLLPDSDAEASPERTLEAFIWLTQRFRGYGAPGIHIFVLTDTTLAEKALQQLAFASPLAVAPSRFF